MYFFFIIFVLIFGEGVYGFIFDLIVGEFIMFYDNIKVLEFGKIYFFNEGNYDMWISGLKKYMDFFKIGGVE